MLLLRPRDQKKRRLWGREWDILISAESLMFLKSVLFVPPRRFSLFLDFFIRSIHSNKHCICPAHKRWWNSTFGMRSRWRSITVHQMGKRRNHIGRWQSGCGHYILEQWHHHSEPSSCSRHFRWQTGKVHLCCIQPWRKNSSTIIFNRR